MNRAKYYAILLGLLVGQVCFFAPKPVSAEPLPAVVINELMWMGSSISSSDEWIELRNLTDQSVDLSGWQLTKRTGGQDAVMLAFPAGKTVAPGGYFLISNFGSDSAQSALAAAPDLVSTAVSLVNSDLQIKLFSGTGALIDTADDGTGAPMAGAYTSGAAWKSMERDAQCADGTLPTSWHTAGAAAGFDPDRPEIGTPGAPNSDPNTPPTARINGPASGLTNAPLNFDGLESADADGDALQFAWDFGDGNYSSQETPTHAFASAGTFTVVLSVSDGRDQSAAQLAVVISQPPAAPDQPSQAPIAPASLQTPSYSRAVVINELLPNPAGDDLAGEFIELYNGSAERVELMGWKISDTGKSYAIGTGLDSTTIEPNGYLVIPRRASGLALNNTTAETVRLFTPDDALLGELVYPVPAPEGQSYGRFNSDWQWCQTPTPGAVNTTAGTDEPDGEPAEIASIGAAKTEAESPPQTTGDISSRVWLTELLPNPTGADTEEEFIELTNFDSRAINLLGWRLTDQSTTYQWKKPVVIGPNESVAVYRPESKISLNNSADQVYLAAPDGKIVNGVNYAKAIEGQSWNRLDATERWAWSAAATPGEPNTLVEASDATEKNSTGSVDSSAAKDTPARTVTIAELLTLPSRAAVTVEGVITVAPGVFGKRIAYLEDATGAVQLTWPTSFELTLAIGDAVQAAGTVSISQDEHRLMVKAADQISVVSRDVSIQPTALTQPPTEAQYNRLVSVTGSVTSQEATGLVLQAGGQTYPVLFKKTANLSVPEIQPDQTVSVTGLLVKDANGPAIWPRTDTDIVVTAGASPDTIASPPVTQAGAGANSLDPKVILGSIVLLAGVAVTIIVIRKRRAAKSDTKPLIPASENIDNFDNL